MTLSILKGADKELNLRIPAWCANPSILLNGEQLSGVRAGAYYTVNRSWKKGDKLTISFPMEERWIERANHSDCKQYMLPGGEIMYDVKPTQLIPYAFLRGPVVYCVDMVWNPQLHNDDCNIEKDIRVDVSQKPVAIKKVDASMMTECFKAKGYYKGIPVELVLTPFANIGQWWRNGETKPQKNADAFTYGIWVYPKK